MCEHLSSIQSIKTWLGKKLYHLLLLCKTVCITNHLQLIRQLVSYLICSDLASVIHVTVNSKLDSCNAFYMGHLLTQSQKLQLVQNMAAGQLLGLSLMEHIQPEKGLHGLPIAYQGCFKGLVLTHKTMVGVSKPSDTSWLQGYQIGHD